LENGSAGLKKINHRGTGAQDFMKKSEPQRAQRARRLRGRKGRVDHKGAKGGKREKSIGG
jgi:hypothetical protein